MDIVNINKEERILINKAKIKILETDKSIKSISSSKAINLALIKFIGGGNNG
jgi:hypothetical protein